jgi:hypothetical protein
MSISFVFNNSQSKRFNKKCTVNKRGNVSRNIEARSRITVAVEKQLVSLIDLYVRAGTPARVRARM